MAGESKKTASAAEQDAPRTLPATGIAIVRSARESLVGYHALGHPVTPKGFEVDLSKLSARHREDLLLDTCITVELKKV